MPATYHAKKRCEERCGIKLDRIAVKYIIYCIHQNRYKLIDKQTNNGNRIVAEVNVNNSPVRVVFLKNSQLIVTVLPNG